MSITIKFYYNLNIKYMAPVGIMHAESENDDVNFNQWAISLIK